MQMCMMTYIPVCFYSQKYNTIIYLFFFIVKRIVIYKKKPKRWDEYVFAQ